MEVGTVSREETCGNVETVGPVEAVDGTQTILKSTAAGSAKLQLAINTSHFHFEGVVDAGAKSRFYDPDPDPKTKTIGPNTNKTDVYQKGHILLTSSLSSATTSASKGIQNNSGKEFLLKLKHQQPLSLVMVPESKAHSHLTNEELQLGAENKKQTQFDLIRSQSRIIPASAPSASILTSNSNQNLLNKSTSTSCASSNAENSFEISFDESRGQGAISSILPDVPLIISSSRSQLEDNLDFPVAVDFPSKNDAENKTPDFNGAVPSVACLPKQTRQIDLDLIELGHANTRAPENIAKKGATDTNSAKTGSSSSTSNGANEFGIPDAKNQQGLLAGLITTAGKKNTVNIYVTQCFNCHGECVRQRISVVSEQPLKINPEILKTTPQPAGSGSSVSSISNNSDSTQDKLDANADISRSRSRITSLLAGPEPETELESNHHDDQFSTNTTATVGVTRQQPEQPTLIPDDNNPHIPSPNTTPNVRKRRRHRPIINKKRRAGVKKQKHLNQNELKLKLKYTPAPLTLASPTSSTSANENDLHQAQAQQGDFTGTGTGMTTTTTTDSDACRNFEVGNPKNYRDLFWTATSEDKTSMIYQCKKCDFNGSSNEVSETKLKEHFQKHYQPNRFICQNSLCKKSYETPSSLKRHYTRTAHNVEIIATTASTASRKSKKAKI